MRTRSSSPTEHPRDARAPARGFTLIEVLIALSAGLMVSMAAFALSKSATKFFQHEARISAAHLSTMLGMNRLTADLQRAGYLSTRNMATDPMVCPTGGSVGLQQLVGIRITPGTAGSAPPQSAVNCMFPDRIDLFGSFDTSEVFAVQDIAPGAGGGMQVTLQNVNNGAMARLRSALPPGTSLDTRIQEIFKAGRLLRFVDDSPRHEYGIIASVSVTGVAPNENIQITLASNPPIQIKTPGNTCGLTPGLNTGVLVSVLSRVRYEIRSLAGDPVLAACQTNAADAVTFDSTRSELVRVEIDTAGNEVPNSLELISEYAVDLKLGVSFSDTGFNPVISTIGINAFPTPNNPQGYGQVSDVPPETIRAVHARLTTRARAPDRETPMSLGPAAICNANHRALRFQLDNDGNYFARVRTLHATVELPNQASFQ